MTNELEVYVCLRKLERGMEIERMPCAECEPDPLQNLTCPFYVPYRVRQEEDLLSEAETERAIDESKDWGFG